MTRRMEISPIPMTIQFSISREKYGVCRKNKGRPKPAFEIILKYHLKASALLLGSDRVLGGLGDAELHHGLGLDLNGLAGLRIASDAGLAVRFHQPAEAGHYEHAVFLGFLHSDVSQLLKKSGDSLVRKFSLLRQITDELSLG